MTTETTNTTRKIKDVISKPSEALAAMCDGLERFADADGFEIDMGTYGRWQFNGNPEPTCFGCAATCTVMHLADYQFSHEQISSFYKHATAIGFDVDDLEIFEYAIDGARSGTLGQLFDYFGILRTARTETLVYRDWALGTENWRRELPKVRYAIEQLQAAGY